MIDEVGRGRPPAGGAGTTVVSIAFGTAMVAAATGCATRLPPITKVVDDEIVITRAVSPQAYEHVSRALLYEEEGRWEEAATELQRALPFDDEAPELHARLAELFLRLGRTDDAAEHVEKSLAIEQTVDGLIARAHVLDERGDEAGMLASLRQAIHLVDKDVDEDDEPSQAERAYLELAQAQVTTLDVVGARATLRRLVQIAPATLEGKVRLAAAAWALGAMAEAEAVLKDVVTAEPGMIDALVTLGNLQAATGRVAAARSTFQTALDRVESPFEIAEGYARWLTARGDVTEAQELADRFAREGEVEAAERAGLERAAKRPDRARAIAEAALLRSPSTPGRLQIIAGQAAEDLGDRAGAVASYLAVGKQAAEFAESRVRAAAVLREQNKLDEAHQMLDQVKKAGKREGDVDLEVSVAESLLDEKRGDAARAARRLDEALTRHPDSARLLLARAAIEERRGDWKRAVALAQKILVNDPADAQALNFAGFVSADHDLDLPRALGLARAAAAIEPASGGILDSVGWAHFRMGELAQAEAFLEQAARLEPRDPEILAHLGDLWARRSDRARAVTFYRQALANDPPDRLRRELRERVRTLEAKNAAER